MKDAKIFKNFVDLEDCKTMIDHLEYLCSINKVTKRDDGRVGLINLDDSIFNGFVKKYYDKSISVLSDEFTKFNGYIVTKYVEGIGLETHAETGPGGETNVLMYLNDDYSGGELTYTNLDGDFHTVKVNTGDMVYCPSWFQHGVNKVIHGTRYLFCISLIPETLQN